jgi:hypothetical protein
MFLTTYSKRENLKFLVFDTTFTCAETDFDAVRGR